MHIMNLLLAQLSLEHVGGVANGAHPLEARLHPLQPRLHLVSASLVALAVPEHRVQLCLSLQHFCVCLIPVLA